MNAIFHRLLWLGTAVLATAFAGPGVAAPQKLYSLSMCVGKFANIADPSETDATKCNVAQVQPLASQTIPTPVQARIFNSSPPTSNSTINAVDLFVNVNWRGVDNSNLQVLDNAGKWSIDVGTASHLKISNLSPVKPQQYVTVQFNVDGQSCGEGTWDAKPYTGATVGSGAIFGKAPGYVLPSTLVACAQLACGDSVSGIQPQGIVLPTDGRFISTLKRGIDEDGTNATGCSALFTYVTPSIKDTLPTSTQVQTAWDKSQADSDIAVFSYVVNFRGAPSTALGTLSVAWLTKTDGTPDFQPALMCDGTANFLPTQYTTLVQDNGNKIDVAAPTVTLPGVPFSIIIEDERLLVTKVNTNTNTWFVTRGVGGTSAVTHQAALPVVSTPFPIVQSSDGYIEMYHSYVSRPAKICVNAITPIDAGRFSATFIDGGDGWVLGR